MEIIVGTIIQKEDKLLLIREGKVNSSCYGLWNFPSGHLEENENIFEGAKRETLEEAGVLVELKKVYPLIHIYGKKEKIVILFLAHITKEVKNHHSDDILEAKWFSFEEIKAMKENLRNAKEVLSILSSVEQNKNFDLDVICDIF